MTHTVYETRRANKAQEIGWLQYVGVGLTVGLRLGFSGIWSCSSCVRSATQRACHISLYIHRRECCFFFQIKAREKNDRHSRRSESRLYKQTVRFRLFVFFADRPRRLQHHVSGGKRKRKRKHFFFRRSPATSSTRSPAGSENENENENEHKHKHTHIGIFPTPKFATDFCRLAPAFPLCPAPPPSLPPPPPSFRIGKTPPEYWWSLPRQVCDAIRGRVR